MSARKPLVSIPHRRVAWNGGETAYVCVRYGVLTGRELKAGAFERRGIYQAAKFRGDHDAAQRLVSECISNNVIDRIIDDVTPYLIKGTPLVCVVPHPPFFDTAAGGADLPSKPKVTNALPLQYAGHLAVLLDATIDTEIVQKARVGRTGLTAFPRLLWQPSFDGQVRPDVAYIIVDDVLTHGGTIAALRSHIVQGGGTVATYTTLAHWSGEFRPLALSGGTWQQLWSLYGNGLSSFWEREIGHDARHLSEAEGRFLAKWGFEQERTGQPLLECLRDRLAEAAAKFE
jgi:hypothetical protein